MINPEISILCPCYNSEKYIKDTVQSFVNQSFKNIEIIISDDNSSDGTYNAIKNNFNDSRIKLFKQEKNLGPSLNSQFVINNAGSEYLALCAGDDVMHIDRMEKTYNFMKKNPNCDMVYTFVDIINGEGDVISHDMLGVFNQNNTITQMLKKFFYSGNFICAPSIMIKKDVFRKLNFNPCLLQLQDFDLWIKMLLSDFNIMCLPKKLTYYRIHDHNLSLQTKDEDKILQIKSRTHFEHVKVLLNFINLITTKEKFEKIFNKTLENEKLIPFNVAIEALSLKTRHHYLFALDVIYNEMLNDEKRDLIYKHHKFEMKDFYTLCNQYKDSGVYTLCNQYKDSILYTNNRIYKKSFVAKFKNSCIKRIKEIKNLINLC